MLKSHRSPVPNQVQTYRCWGSKGAVAPPWYDAVQHGHMYRAMTFWYDAISLCIFPFHTDKQRQMQLLCVLQNRHNFLKVARCQLLLWPYCFRHISILKSITTISNVFLETDFSHESPCSFFPLTRCFKPLLSYQPLSSELSNKRC